MYVERSDAAHVYGNAECTTSGELAFTVFSNYYALEFIDTPFHGQFDAYKRLLLLKQP